MSLILFVVGTNFGALIQNYFTATSTLLKRVLILANFSDFVIIAKFCPRFYMLC